METNSGLENRVERHFPLYIEAFKAARAETIDHNIVLALLQSTLVFMYCHYDGLDCIYQIVIVFVYLNGE